MINSIRNIEVSLGSKKKLITSNEIDNQNKIRKSIYALKNIKKDELF